MHKIRCILLALLLLLPCSVCLADYAWTEQELTQLETQLQTARSSIQISRQELATLNEQLVASQNKLAIAEQNSEMLKKQLNELMNNSELQKEALSKANQYLAEYEREAKQKERKLKAERNIAYILSTILLLSVI